MAPKLAETNLPRAIILFVLAASFLVYEMGMQVSPGVITDQLMRDLHLNAWQLGLMAGFYFYTYTAMQIPAGLLYDRFTVRSVMILPLLICAYGSYLFGISDSMVDGAIARVLMGAGGAFAFISVLVVAADVFPDKYFALLAGITQLLAALGAMFGEAPLIPIIDTYGWRHTMVLIAFVGFGLAFIIWFVVNYPKEFPDREEQASSHSAMSSVKAIAANPQTWVIALYALLLWAPMASFASLWGVPYLMKAHSMSKATAATIVLLMWCGIGAGSPLLGWWSDKIGLRKLPLMVSSLTGFIALSLVVFVPNLPTVLVGLFVFLAGAACSGQVLSFAVVRENNQRINHAAAIGFNNMAVVISGALFQPLVGKLIHSSWSGVMVKGLPVYSAQDYTHGMLVVPMSYALGALICFFLIKETHCKNMSER